MAFDDVNEFLAGSGVRATTFPDKGTVREGIIRDAEVADVINPQGVVQYQKDGVTPQRQLVITWDSNEFDSDDPADTGRRKLYLKWRAQRALTDAVYAATGSRQLEEGAKLTVTFTHEEKVPNSQFKAKVYDVKYEKPTKKFDVSGDVRPVQPELDTAPPSYPADKLKLAATLAASDTDVEVISAATGIPVPYLKQHVVSF